ncbi:uncharacterized protein [Diadema antillarum]|uniref:uncharacterized protein n=1 Tax=Diadema antillarum TaxID=105358 RepID=UPI003A864283
MALTVELEQTCPGNTLFDQKRSGHKDIHVTSDMQLTDCNVSRNACFSDDEFEEFFKGLRNEEETTQRQRDNLEKITLDMLDQKSLRKGDDVVEMLHIMEGEEKELQVEKEQQEVKNVLGQMQSLYTDDHEEEEEEEEEKEVQEEKEKEEEEEEENEERKEEEEEKKEEKEEECC